MIYILLSVICSVTVAVLLKLSRRYQISINQIVTWNYLFAIAFGVLFFKPKAQDLINNPTWIHLALGVLLPLIFWFLAAAIKNLGIVKTDIAQRLSLFIPLLAAYFIFKEQMAPLKLAGLALGLLAVCLVLLKRQKSSINSGRWFYALVVFLGFGIIDILFKKIAQTQNIPYTTSLIIVFTLAFLVSITYVLFRVGLKREKLALLNVFYGALLGIFNFGNILFYLKAHRALAANPSTVFAAMNIGVIVLGSLIGVYLFKEKLSRINYIGLALALGAIILITLSQVYAV